jgi:hypothetical protein
LFIENFKMELKHIKVISEGAYQRNVESYLGLDRLVDERNTFPERAGVLDDLYDLFEKMSDYFISQINYLS